MLDICTDCIKRQYCSSLCPEADMYAGQDWIYQKELVSNKLDYTKPWPDIKQKSIFTKTELLILHALFNGKTRPEIAKSLKISISSIRSHLRNIRKKSCINFTKDI